MKTIAEKDGVSILLSESGEYCIEYKLTSIEFRRWDKTKPEKALEKRFVIVLRNRLNPTHYRLVDPIKDELTYWTGNAPWSDVKDAMEWVNDFKRGRKAVLRNEYELYDLMPECDSTMDWLDSYMPLPRKSIPNRLRVAVYMKCDGHCAYCGKPIRIDEMQVDHVNSHYRHKGKDELANYLPSCRDCNGLKSDYTLEEFRNVLIPNCAKHSMFARTGRELRICKAYKLNLVKKTKIKFYFEKEGIK